MNGNAPLRRAVAAASLHSPDAIALIERGQIVVWNRPFATLFAIPADATSLDVEALLGSDAGDSLLAHSATRLRRALRGSEAVATTTDTLYDEDGVAIPFQFELERLADTPPVRLLRIQTELTGGALDPASSDREALRSVSSEAIWDWNLESNEVEWSYGLESLFGYDLTRVDSSADWWIEHIHPEDRERVVHSIHEAIDGAGDAWSDEYRFQRADESWARIQDRGSILREPDGRATRMIGAMLDVSELRAQVRNRQQVEERHRALIRALAQIVWTTAANGEVEDIPEWRTYTGQTPEQVRGYGWLDALHPDDRDHTAKAWDRALQSGGDTEYAVSYRLRGSDGVYRWFDARGVPILDAEGEIREWVGVCINVDGRKRAEAAVLEQEDQFRTLANSIPQLAWMAEADGYIFWYNQRWFDYTGTTLEDMEGWGWRSVHHPDHVGLVEDRFRVALQSGEPWEDTFPLLNRDGEFRWFLSRALPIRDRAGNVVRWFGTNTDVTDQMRDQEERERLIAAIESERIRLQTVFENAPSAIAITYGENHVFASANPMFRSLLGGRSVMGKPIAEAVPEMERQGFVRMMDDAYATGKAKLGNEVRARIDGGDRGIMQEAFFNFVYQPLKSPDGGVEGLLIQAVNVTELVRARQLVEAARAAAEDANRAKSDFLATMSHELRTPLNAMIGYANLLEMGVPEPIGDRARENVSRIVLSARHLLQLIEEVLTFSRIEAGREEIHPEPVDLHELADEVAAIIEPLARDKALHFNIHVQHQMPTVETDPRKLRQVLVNLLGNAVKFTDEGEISLEIARRNGTVELCVRDTGIGIAHDHLEMIFEPFRQVESQRTRRAEGTGLGLSVSRRLTHLMGGRLSVNSEVGVGSEFCLSLPAERRQARSPNP